MLMALRPQDPLPDWISHVLLIDGQKLRTRTRDSIMPTFEQQKTGVSDASAELPITHEGKVLVSMKDVNVKYHDRHVSSNILKHIPEGASLSMPT